MSEFDPKPAEQMKRVLRYENRKVDPVFWDASTPELLGRAFVALVKHLHEDWEVYSQLADDCKPELEIPAILAASSDPDRVAEREKLTKAHARELAEWEEQRGWLNGALQGNMKAASNLLRARQDYEYEDWALFNVEEE